MALVLSLKLYKWIHVLRESTLQRIYEKLSVFSSEKLTIGLEIGFVFWISSFLFSLRFRY